MRQTSVRRKLQETQSRIAKLRGDLAILDEQIMVVDEEAESLRVRAVVSETPLAIKEHAESARHAELAHRARTATIEQIATLEAERDALLESVTIEAGFA